MLGQTQLCFHTSCLLGWYLLAFSKLLPTGPAPRVCDGTFDNSLFCCSVLGYSSKYGTKERRNIYCTILIAFKYSTFIDSLNNPIHCHPSDIDEDTILNELLKVNQPEKGQLASSSSSQSCSISGLAYH